MRLQFIFNNKQVKITTILFKNVTPILDVDKIAYFKETQLSGTWLKKEFRYSFDNTVWSNWGTLTQQALINLKFTNQTNFYIEFLYTRAKYNSAGIEDLYLFYDSNSGTPVDPSIGTIDADTLQGQDGQYYLNRDNQFGDYSDIIFINTPTDPSIVANSGGIYDASLRIDSCLGTTISLKRIVGVGGIIVRDVSNGTIEIDASGGIGGGSYYENPDPVVETVGGIGNGDAFFADGKTFAETMASMFYPVKYPSLIDPSNTFNSNAVSLQEIGDSINVTFTATFNRGSINPAYNTTGFRSGLPNTYTYTGTGISGSIPTSGMTNIQTISNYIVLDGIQAWTAFVSYDGGDQPLDSEGNPYNTALPAGSTSPRSETIEGVYPIFATTSNITTLTQQSLVSMLTGNNIQINMVPETGGSKQTFDIAEDWTNVRPLFGIQTYNSFSSSWDYQGGTGPSSLTNWTITPETRIIHGNVVNYFRYIYNNTDRSDINIRLVF